MDDDEFPPDEDVVNETFKRAIDFVALNASVMNQDDLLYLYGRYKQVHNGPCKEPMPGILKFRNRSKWSAWNALGDMTKEEAMQQYIDKLNEFEPGWDSSKSKESKEKKNFGPVNSSCLKIDPELKEESKTVFDFVKEGNIDKVKLLISNDSSVKNAADSDGLSLLHWACDRGHQEIAVLLVSSGADLDKQDSDGQTPLHYASSCGHESVVKMLLTSGANVEVVDSDGLRPPDVAYNSTIKELLLTVSAANV